MGFVHAPAVVGADCAAFLHPLSTDTAAEDEAISAHTRLQYAPAPRPSYWNSGSWRETTRGNAGDVRDCRRFDILWFLCSGAKKRRAEETRRQDDAQTIVVLSEGGLCGGVVVFQVGVGIFVHSFEKSIAIDSGEKVELAMEGKSRTPAADYDHLAKQFVALDRVSEAAASTKKTRSLMASWYAKLQVHIRHKVGKIHKLLFGAPATEEVYELATVNAKAKENE
ncbi:hypothetical protein C8R46DRAFT_1185523 [Mycena filopes]|nr:hypothetical protein C8R46DRAFT_1185523 [Mycena filopes]